MSKRKIAGTVADPTLPKTPVTVGGKSYNLCLTFRALAEAEAAINRELYDVEGSKFVNLLYALPARNLGNTLMIFAAALRTFHPEIGFEEAQALISTQQELFEVSTAIYKAWSAATPEPEVNPPSAQE